MKLKTIKKRYYDVTKPDFLSIITVLLTDGVWCNERVNLLSESMTQLVWKFVFPERELERIEWLTGKSVGKLPDWIKMQLIMKEPRTGPYLGKLSDELATVWNLIK